MAAALLDWPLSTRMVRTFLIKLSGYRHQSLWFRELDVRSGSENLNLKLETLLGSHRSPRRRSKRKARCRRRVTSACSIESPQRFLLESFYNLLKANDEAVCLLIALICIFCEKERAMARSVQGPKCSSLEFKSLDSMQSKKLELRELTTVE